MPETTTQTFEFTRTLAYKEQDKDYQAFSGCDMAAYMGHVKIGTLQGITVSITREVVPIYVMGNPNPRAFVKGKRAIAGNMVFSQFDKHAVLREASAFGSYRRIGQLPGFEDWKEQNLFEQNTGVYGNYNSDWVARVKEQMSALRNEVAKRELRFVDQIPPFDVTITMVNEAGASAFAAIHSVQLVNEGHGWTLDDLTSEMAITYIARDVTPLTNWVEDARTKLGG